MWSCKMKRPGAAQLAVLGLAGLLSGCFRPLYGPTPSGVPLQDALASIDVADVDTAPGQERLGHYLRSELIFDLDGSGTPHAKRYKLAMTTSERTQPTTVDVTTGRADAALLTVSVKYVLSRDGKQVTTGIARGSATYYRDQQRFASVRAARDAEIRAAQTIADDIKQRLAALFATTP